MLIRKIAKSIRGKATPFQIIAACVIGCALGFLPGLTQAPGLMLFWLLLLLVLNANLAIAGLVGLGAKALAFVLLPVTFEIGRVLLDGPTEPIFKAAVNTPVLAWFGFEYYAVTGGQAVGLVLGVVGGVLLTKAIMNYRKKMAELEEGSERFQKWSSKKSVRLLTWLLIGKGGKGKKSYAEVLDAKNKPIRIIGVVAALLMVALLYVGSLFATEPIVTALTRKGLEQANGATVDLDSASLDLSANSLVLTGLAMADPGALGTNIFAAAQLNADVSGMDLLTKRIALDRLVIDEASSGEARRIPGVLIKGGPESGAPPEPEEGEDDAKTIDDYMKDAEKWKDRLAQVQSWLEKLGGGDDSEATPEEQAESRKERIKRQIRDLGRANVKAEGLIDGAPTFLVRELVVNGVSTAQLPGEVFEVNGANLSTHPGLVADAGALRVASRSGDHLIDLDLAGQAEGSTAPSTANIVLKNLSVDGIMGQLSSAAPLSGGTMEIDASGLLNLTGRPSIDLPVNAVFRNTTVTVPGQGPQQLDELTIPLQVTGPIDNPSVSISDDAMRQALIDAGKGALADKLGGELENVIGDNAGDLLEDSGIDAGDAADKAKDAIGNLFGGGGDKEDEDNTDE